jgi:hypothetical protein
VNEQEHTLRPNTDADNQRRMTHGAVASSTYVGRRPKRGDADSQRRMIRGAVARLTTVARRPKTYGTQAKLKTTI